MHSSVFDPRQMQGSVCQATCMFIQREFVVEFVRCAIGENHSVDIGIITDESSNLALHVLCLPL